MRATFTNALTPLLFLTLPAAIGLYELRLVIPQTVFQLGAFDASSTALVAPALQFLALGLVWYALVEVLARIFYAMHDTVTPVVAGIAIIVINIVMGALLVDSLGHSGLAIALTASTGVEALILFWILRRRIGGLGPTFGSWVARLALAAAAMTAMAELVRPKLEQATAPGAAHRLTQLLLLAYAAGLIAATYFLAAHALRMPEMARGLALVKRRLAFLGL
jgi:putative peptidoglycan lipid II flippase